MKLSVSTSCCSDWNFDEIYSTAKDLGYSGIEIRKLGDSVYAPRMKIFAPEAIDITIEKLSDAKMELTMLASSAVVGKAGLVEEALSEVREYSQLAKKLGVSYIRVLAGSRPDDYNCDLDLTIDTLVEMCSIAGECGVSILVETNSIFSDSTLLKEVLDLVNNPYLGVVWDINYPYRYFDESAASTVETLKEYIKFVHIKDSLAKGEEIEYRLLGHGDLPVDEVLTSLKSIGYKGYLSFEWIPKWSSELVEPGIVIAHYASYMQRLLKKIS